MGRDLEDDLGRLGCSVSVDDTKDELMEKAQDRDEWRRFSRRARYSDAASHSND